MKYRCEFLILLTFLILITNAIVQAQVDTLWTKMFGGGGTDLGSLVQQTIDEGYIIVGGTSSFGAGGLDVWLIKTNAFGDTLWTKTFGGSNSDLGYSVENTTDGGYIITGYTYSFGAGTEDIWLIKTNASGDTLWTKTFGGSNWDISYSVQQTSDEGYIIVGSTSSFGAGADDVWLIKTNTLGDPVWTKTFGGDYSDYGYSVQQTTDGGYIIVGTTYSFSVGVQDIWLIKTNSVGDTLWTKTFWRGEYNEVGSVQQTTDGGYIIVGTTELIGAGGLDIWIIKTNSSGDTLWTKSFGGESGDFGYSVQQTADGGYIIIGNTGSFGAGGYDIWLIKTNDFGDTLWTKTFGGSLHDDGRSVLQTPDMGYIIVGDTYSYGGYNVLLVKTTPEGTKIEQDKDIIALGYSLQQNYPNPFNPTTQINYSLPYSNNVSLSIYDLSGKEVQTLVNDYQTVGNYSLNFNASHLSSGIYFYQLRVGNDFIATKKMIVMR